jgi:hypothetical protein
MELIHLLLFAIFCFLAALVVPRSCSCGTAPDSADLPKS